MERPSCSVEESESEEEMTGVEEEDNARKSDSEGATSSENELYCVYDSDGNDTYRHAYETNSSDAESGAAYNECANDGCYFEGRAWGPGNQPYSEAEFLEGELEGSMEPSEIEEVQARRIQRRIVSELNESDFVVALRASERQGAENEKLEGVTRDVSSLSSRQKLNIMTRESPEFFFLVQDLKNKLNEIDNVLIPILNYFGNTNNMPAPVKFLKKKFLVLTNYCTNITFYLLLKAKKNPVENHPVLKSLYKYRRVMEEIKELDEAMRPKIEKVLMDLKDNKNPALEKLACALRKKNILKWIKKSKEEMMLRESEDDAAGPSTETFELPTASTSGIHYIAGLRSGKNAEKSGKRDKGKRAITYQMAKNKGLIPRRNKLQRNPRVKHRNKYKKALIKRRGQVRFPRTEIPAYGGEPSGIKSNVTKSIKFK